MIPKQEKVFLATIPYLSPSFPPLALAIIKGVLDNHSIINQTRDLNLDVLDYFNSEEIGLIEKFCADQVWTDRRLVRKLRLFFRSIIKKHIVPFSPTIVGASLFSFFMQRTAELFCLEVRSLLPKVKIFLGGSGVTSFNINNNTDDWSKKAIQKQIADSIIVGEGEVGVINFIKEKETGIQFVPQIRDLSQYPIQPNFADLPLEKYQDDRRYFKNNQNTAIPITGSRGCVRKCSFCNVESLWPKFVYRPAKQIVDQIEHFKKTTGIKNFKFTDSLVNGSTKNWRELNQEIVKRGLDIEYQGFFIAKPFGQILKEDYAMAKKAGASKFLIGVESGSESVRNHMRKKFDNKSLYDCIENLLEENIDQNWQLITGYPLETDDDFQETVNLLYRYKDYSNQIDTTITSFLLLPDSPVVWHPDFKDLTFKSEYENSNGGDSKSIISYWICDQNPTLDFKKRLKRFYELEELSDKLGYSVSPWSKHKKYLRKEHKIRDHLNENQLYS